MSKRSRFLHGARDTLPLLIGVAPFGMIYGVLAVNAGLPPGAAQAMSLFLFAGSAQFMIVQLVDAGTPWLVIALTAFMINLRHALYSASIAPYIQQLSKAWKGFLAYVLVDEVYAVAITHYDQNEPRGEQHWYFLGAGLTLWAAWQSSTAAGILLGAQIPPEWSLDFTLALTFIALVVPGLKDRPALVAAVTAGAAAVAAYSLPNKTGLILAALIGIGAGVWSERK